MIQFVERAKIPELKKIWQACFSDNEVYIDFYFNSCFDKEVVLGYFLDEKVVSMLSLLPAEIIENKEKCPVRYIYAVATLPEYQRKGYSSALLSYAQNWLKNRGEFGILVPAKEELFSFYKKRGFIREVNIEEIVLKIESSEETNSSFVAAAGFWEEEELKLQEISAKEYKKFRDLYFYREGYLCWGEKQISYAVKETLFGNGFCKKIWYQEGEYVLLGRIADECLIIHEITAEGEEAYLIGKVLGDYFRCEKVMMRLRTSTLALNSHNNLKIEQKLTRPFALIYTGEEFEKQDQKIGQEYVNLVLD